MPPEALAYKHVLLQDIDNDIAAAKADARKIAARAKEIANKAPNSLLSDNVNTNHNADAEANSTTLTLRSLDRLCVKKQI